MGTTFTAIIRQKTTTPPPSGYGNEAAFSCIPLAAGKAQEQGGAGGLETADEQVGVFEGLSIEEQAELLRRTLEELKNLKNRVKIP